MSPTLCRHCRRAPVSRSRGLCWTCFYLPGVRELYPDRRPVSRLPDANGRYALPPEPTNARPGTPEKVEVLCRRARLRCSLWHPYDATLDES